MVQAEPYDSEADTEKMSTHSDTSSALSAPVPVATTELDIEKTASRATQGSRRSAGLTRTITSAYDWTGDDDPDNPLNWSVGKKIYHTLVPGLQAFVVTFGSSVYTPSKNGPKLPVFPRMIC